MAIASAPQALGIHGSQPGVSQQLQLFLVLQLSMMKACLPLLATAVSSIKGKVLSRWSPRLCSFKDFPNLLFPDPWPSQRGILEGSLLPPYWRFPQFLRGSETLGRQQALSISAQHPPAGYSPGQDSTIGKTSRAMMIICTTICR